jgi:hypothetical protein
MKMSPQNKNRFLCDYKLVPTNMEPPDGEVDGVLRVEVDKKGRFLSREN